MKILTLAALAVSLFALPAKAQGPNDQAPLVEIKVESTKPGDGGVLMRDASIARDHKRWWSGRDYPATEFAARRSGMATLDVRIGADDKVIDCRPVPPESAAVFVEAGCAIVRRGSFIHALGVDGTPAAGRLTVYVTFNLRMPGEVPPAPTAPFELPANPREPVPAAPDAYTIRSAPPALFPNRSPYAVAYVNADGSVRTCFVLTSAGTDAGDEQACRHVLALRFEPVGQDVPRKFIALTVAP